MSHYQAFEQTQKRDTRMNKKSPITNQNISVKERPLNNLNDLTELIFITLDDKFFSGVNLITGRSNLRTFIEMLAEILISLVLLEFLLDGDAKLSDIPVKYIGWIYFVKYCYLLIDSSSLVFYKVLNLFDIFNILVDGVFWFFFSLCLGDAELRFREFLTHYAYARFAWHVLFWIVSQFIYARDDPVSLIFFYLSSFALFNFEECRLELW